MHPHVGCMPCAPCGHLCWDPLPGSPLRRGCSAHCPPAISVSLTLSSLCTLLPSGPYTLKSTAALLASVPYRLVICTGRQGSRGWASGFLRPADGCLAGQAVARAAGQPPLARDACRPQPGRAAAWDHACRHAADSQSIGSWAWAPEFNRKASFRTHHKAQIDEHMRVLRRLLLVLHHVPLQGGRHDTMNLSVSAALCLDCTLVPRLMLSVLPARGCQHALRT